MPRGTFRWWSWRATCASALALVASCVILTPGPAGASGRLQPAPLGYGQCQAAGFSDGSTYGQIAVSRTTCAVAANVASKSDLAKGASYHNHGFKCSSTPEGKDSKWAAAWGAKYYAYSCKDRSRQVAFNWGFNYDYGQSPTITTTITGSGTLEPAPVGFGQCQASQFPDGSVDGQVAVSGTTCTVATNVEAGSNAAQGSSYEADGFTCVGTVEGAGSQWAAAWSGPYYAYSCKDGGEQVAFTWGDHYAY
ncbi:MAG: hypothetical protein WA786_03580 [Acidimicrobiales bacterium]